MNIKYVFIMISIFIFSFSLYSQKDVYKYVGVKKCKTCHKSKKSGKQYDIWLNGPHAKAYETLKTEKAIKAAKEKGIDNPSEDQACLKCHATMAAVAESLHTKTLTMEEGVSCESCHGPGSEYRKRKIMKSRELSLQNGLIIPDEKVCVQCHQAEGNDFFQGFVFEERVKEIAHPTPKKKK